MRSAISPAALFVNVIAATPEGLRARGQAGDPAREHAGLARTRAGEDEERPVGVRDGLALRLVEAGQQRVVRRQDRFDREASDHTPPRSAAG